MSVFLVKSHPYPPSLDTRVLEIEAEEFFYNPESGCFEFLKDTGNTLVAAVPSSGVFAVVEEDAEFDDYVASSEPDEEDSLDFDPNSLEFVEYILDLIDFWHEYESEKELEDSPENEQEPEQKKATVEFRYYKGEPMWGVAFGGLFIPYFGSRMLAESAVPQIEKGCDLQELITSPLFECPLAEEPNE